MRLRAVLTDGSMETGERVLVRRVQQPALEVNTTPLYTMGPEGQLACCSAGDGDKAKILKPINQPRPLTHNTGEARYFHRLSLSLGGTVVENSCTTHILR